MSDWRAELSDLVAKQHAAERDYHERFFAARAEWDRALKEAIEPAYAEIKSVFDHQGQGSDVHVSDGTLSIASDGFTFQLTLGAEGIVRRIREGDGQPYVVPVPSSLTKETVLELFMEAYKSHRRVV